MIGSPLKWALLVVAVLAAVVAGRWLRDRPSLQIRAWTFVGFLPFCPRLDMALVSFGTRAGDTQGFEVALLDWLALTLMLARKAPARPFPFRFAMGAYLLVAVASVAQAQWPLGASGYVWKLCRMYLLVAAIWRAGGDPRVPPAILRGLTLGIVYEGLWTAWQHFGLGVHQATGSFSHQNTLGMLVNLVVMASVALVFAGPASSLTTLAPVVALPICFFTVSRGTLLFFGVGSLLVYVASAMRKFTLRKARLGLVGLALILALVPLAVVTLGSRPSAVQADSLKVRWRYESAASMMLRDHPLGIGPNHFTTMLLTGGYGDRAGVDWFNKIGIVHNVYWLTAAEMGYAGLLALGVLFLSPIVSAFRYAFRAGPDRRGDVLLGLGVGLALFCVHSFFEWVWRSVEVSYVFWMTVGMVASLTRQVAFARST